jgi:hypothetical protein
LPSLHLDLMRDFKRVGAHLVAAAACLVLEARVNCCRAGCGKPAKPGRREILAVTTSDSPDRLARLQGRRRD